MKLGTLFSDGAVLQQGRINPVLGKTLPGQLIEAAIAGQTAYTRSSNDGTFMIYLPPLSAGGPYELKISLTDNETENITVKDVLIGEVWLCSGQSNMEYCLGTDWSVKDENRKNPPVNRLQEKEFIKNLKDPDNFRFITVPRKITGCREQYFTGEWHHMDAEHAPEASAVGAWFGSVIRRDLKTPVGLICCAWGGTCAEAWSSPSALLTNPETRPLLEDWRSMQQEKDVWMTKEENFRQYFLAKITHPDPGNTGFEQGWATPDFDDSAWAEMSVPGSWIKQGIAGNGAVWIRKQAKVPAELAGKDLVLKTGGIDKHDIAYFNGVEIGRTGKDFEENFYNTPRRYKIPGKLVKAGINTIAIRAFSFLYDGSFSGNPEDIVLSAQDQEIPLAGLWKAKAEFDWGIFDVPHQIFGIQNPNTPGILFDSMIRPLLPYSLRGIIWYQGETNAQNKIAAAAYKQTLETMIRDWRCHFEQPDLPFIQVQLADFRSPKDYDPSSVWAILRESQRKVCGSLPNVFLATALDTGEELDIHPQNKKDVGIRLAASALHYVYGQENTLPSGPVFRKAVSEENALRVFFHFAEGMELRGDPGSSFYLAGADGQYYPADKAEIFGDSILLASSQVKEPVAVRYAWSDNPRNILYNQHFPAMSFSSENQ